MRDQHTGPTEDGTEPLALARPLRFRAWTLIGPFAALILLVTSVSGARASGLEISLAPSSTTPYYACPHGPCQLVIDPATSGALGGWGLSAGPRFEGGGEKGGIDPQEIQAAYRIPTSGGDEQTVAVIDAYGDPWAQEQLSTYRSRYGLPPCTKADDCFSKVNQKGEEGNYPPPETKSLFEYLGWLAETATDMEMVSAACPHCHILLVEANRATKPADMAASVDTAVRLGATEVSNSYLYSEGSSSYCGTSGCTQYRSSYEHPGIPITAASGDEGYYGFVGTFPASVPDVIAVGGTNLYKASNSPGSRPWREEAWEKTGSGCSTVEPKPAWQTDLGCKKRTENDVAAVAGCKTPVSIFFSGENIQTHEVERFWEDACGTSIATPIIAAIEAYATTHTKSLGPEGFYEDPSALFDVTSGNNGTCSPAYLCTAEVGYDGPTGLGTPDGVPFVPSPVG